MTKQHFAPRVRPDDRNPRGLREGDRVDVEWNHALLGGRAQMVDGVHVVVSTGSTDQYPAPARLALVPEAIAADAALLRRVSIGFDTRWLSISTHATLGMYEP